MKSEILGTLNPTVGFEKQQISRINLTFAIDKRDSPEHEIQLLDIQISNLVQSLIENELLVLNEKRNRRFYTEFRMILHRLYEDSTQILHRFHSESTQILRKFYTDSTQSLHRFYKNSTQILHRVCMILLSLQKLYTLRFLINVLDQIRVLARYFVKINKHTAPNKHIGIKLLAQKYNFLWI